MNNTSLGENPERESVRANSKDLYIFDILLRVLLQILIQNVFASPFHKSGWDAKLLAKLEQLKFLLSYFYPSLAVTE